MRSPGCQGEPDPLEDGPLAVPGRRLVQPQQGVGQALRGAEGEVEGGIHMGRGDQLHALQGLDAALRLAGLARLGAEALHEGVHVGDLALLAREGRLLLGQALGALALEGAVVAGVGVGAGLLDVADVGDHRIEEVPVVGDQHQGPGVRLEPGLQPDDRVQVQVVGGLVEQQQVRAAHQGAAQGQAHAPAPGVAVHRAGAPRPTPKPSPCSRRPARLSAL